MPSAAAPEALLDELFAIAQEVAGGAARILQRYSDVRLQEVETKSSPTDLVSEADRASEAFIVAELRRARPHDSLLSEEGTAHTGTSEVRWVADPLDGTTNFFFRVPAYSVSLAAEYQGRAVVGIVVDPSRQETWTAVRGRGAQCNGVACRAAVGRSEVATALVATGFSYQHERRLDQASVLVRLLPAVRDIRRFGSAAIDLCWLAGGRVDAFYEAGLNAWDWAAGGLICEEAGAQLTIMPDGTLLAATPGLMAPLAALLAG